MNEPKQIEDAAPEVHAALVREATDHASLCNYRRACADAEQAQGAARPPGLRPPERPTGDQEERRIGGSSITVIGRLAQRIESADLEAYEWYSRRRLTVSAAEAVRYRYLPHPMTAEMKSPTRASAVPQLFIQDTVVRPSSSL